MLLYYIALGIIGASSGGGGGGGMGPYTDVGAVIASPARTAVLLAVQDTAARTTGIPYGAVAWKQQFDPADHVPYALDFTALLATGEKIAEIEEIFMNATAALLGVEVDTASGYGPLIDTDGKRAQVWFTADEAYWDGSSFDAGGVQLPTSMRIITDSTPPKRFERTGVLTVHQL